MGISVYDVLDAARHQVELPALSARAWSAGTASASIPIYLAHCAAGARPPSRGHPRRPSHQRRHGRARSPTASPMRSRADGKARRPRMLVLGLTFKENMPDLRNTQGRSTWCSGLAKRGHRVDVHDPLADPPPKPRRNTASSSLADLPPRRRRRAVRLPRRRRGARRPIAPSRPRISRGWSRPGGLVADIKGMWRATVLPEGLGRWQL